MANSLEFIAGKGIKITANDADKSLTISSNVSQESINTLNSECIKELHKSPEGFPKIFTESSNFVIPKTGTYRVSMVGGGGSGGVNHEDKSEGNNGGTSMVTIKEGTYCAPGGLRGMKDKAAVPNIPYKENVRGYVRGGDPSAKGNDGIGAGGVAGHHSGGGAGSPLKYGTDLELAGNGIRYEIVGAKGGKGYGAGGGGCGSNANENNSGGGSSGCLYVGEHFIVENDVIKIVIGSGGQSVTIGKGLTPETAAGCVSGAGAPGALLLEWVKFI